MTLNQTTSAFATNTEAKIDLKSYIPDAPVVAKTTCNDVIQACDEALAAKNKEIDFSIRVITTQDTELTRVRQDLRDEVANNNVWYKNPTILILLGVVAGVAISK